MPLKQRNIENAITNLSKTIPLKEPGILQQAMTHRSWLNEHPEEQAVSNERLEFLGDAVLELVVTQYLYEHFPQKPEGELTSLRASLVRTETLAKIADTLRVGEALKLSRGEELGGGRKNASLLANTFEALVGAIYISKNMSAVKRFVNKYLIPELAKIMSDRLYRDAKSQLQEIVQAKGLPAPAYRVIKEEGPDHEKTFTVAVLVDGKHLSQGNGKSKQQAQQEAAAIALVKFKSE